MFVEYAKASPEDILIQITRPQPRPGGGRAARPADALVPQPVVVARQPPTGRRCSRSPAATAASVVQAVDAELGERYLYCEGDAPLLFTENETNTQRIFGVAEPHARTSRTASTTTSSTARTDAVNPGEDRAPRSAAHYRLTVGPGECQVDPAAAHRRRARRPAAQSNGNAAAPFGSRFDEVVPGAARRGRRVLRRRHPAVARRRRGQRHAAGPGRHALEQAVLPLRRRQVARRARLRPVQGDAQGRPAQRPLAPHVQRRRDLDAGQVGVPVVRRLGPRLPRPRPDARRSRTSASSSSS